MSLINNFDNPAVIWLTGLSGSGKTTIAKSLQIALQMRGVEPVMLDGDEIRATMQLRGFDEQSRKTHNHYVGYMAAVFEKRGHTVIVSLISPYAEIRNQIRAICQNFIEVHVCTPLETCIERDPKGLYQKALAGELKEFTGISAPYEAPSHPEISLDTAAMHLDECTERLLQWLLQRNS